MEYCQVIEKCSRVAKSSIIAIFANFLAFKRDRHYASSRFQVRIDPMAKSKMRKERATAVFLLLNQRIFLLDEESFTAFIAALDAQITDDAELKSLLTEPSPWDD